MEDGREKQRGTRVSAFEIRSEIRLEDPADGETRGGARCGTVRRRWPFSLLKYKQLQKFKAANGSGRFLPKHATLCSGGSKWKIFHTAHPPYQNNSNLERPHTFY